MLTYMVCHKGIATNSTQGCGYLMIRHTLHRSTVYRTWYIYRICSDCANLNLNYCNARLADDDVDGPTRSSEPSISKTGC